MKCQICKLQRAPIQMFKQASKDVCTNCYKTKETVEEYHIYNEKGVELMPKASFSVKQREYNYMMEQTGGGLIK